MNKELLFHYTDLDAFLSIIKNRKLWLTRATHLNDHQEITWLHSKIKTKLEALAPTHGHQTTNQIWDSLMMRTANMPYICSFCQHGDLLSQWRAYSQNGAGVSIGFKRTALPQEHAPKDSFTIDRPSTSLWDVIYDKNGQQAFVNCVLEQELQNNPLRIDDIVSKLEFLCCISKNPAFSEENESRIIHHPSISITIGSPEIKFNNPISATKYRTAGGRLITYFEYDFDNQPASDIFSDIYLGPKSEISDLELRIFLTEAGLPNLTVHRSSASYK